jgi:hypothetical protein
MILSAVTCRVSGIHGTNRPPPGPKLRTATPQATTVHFHRDMRRVLASRVDHAGEFAIDGGSWRQRVLEANVDGVQRILTMLDRMVELISAWHSQCSA